MEDKQSCLIYYRNYYYYDYQSLGPVVVVAKQ